MDIRRRGRSGRQAGTWHGDLRNGNLIACPSSCNRDKEETAQVFQYLTQGTNSCKSDTTLLDTSVCACRQLRAKERKTERVRERKPLHGIDSKSTHGFCTSTRRAHERIDRLRAGSTGGWKVRKHSGVHYVRKFEGRAFGADAHWLITTDASIILIIIARLYKFVNGIISASHALPLPLLI